MGKSNISDTTFGVAPDATLVVVDAFDAKLGSLIGNPSGAELPNGINTESLLQSVTPQQLTDLMNDPVVKKTIADTGQTLNGYVASVKQLMPSTTTDLSKVLGSSSLSEIETNAKRLKGTTPNGIYRNIETDVMAKTMQFTNGFTLKNNPLGDYFCKKRGRSLGSSDSSFSWDKAMAAALNAAIAAIGARNLCGFDTVGFVDELTGVDDGGKVAIGKTIAKDGARNGVVDSVSNLLVRFAPNFNSSERREMAEDLAETFTAGESTILDELEVFQETMIDLSPDFEVPSSKGRMELLVKMNDITLTALATVPEFQTDASVAKMFGSTKKKVSEVHKQYPALA